MAVPQVVEAEGWQLVAADESSPGGGECVGVDRASVAIDRGATSVAFATSSTNSAPFCGDDCTEMRAPCACTIW